MRPGRRPQRTYAKRSRPIRWRSAVVLAVAVASGVGLIAFPTSAVAAPPVVPICTFPATTGSDSCATLRVNAVTPPIGGALESVGLGFRIRSQFSPSSSEITTSILRFDDDIALNLSGIPACPASEVTLKSIAQAYEQCGPGADGNPPSEGNAFLSPPGNVSGIAGYVPPISAVGCTMIFKGADNAHVSIYLRAPVSSEAGCNNPATNSAGSGTAVFTGTLTHQPAASPYDWTLTVPGIDSYNPSLDDFYATVQRGSAFRARCPAGTSPHRMQGTWDYTAAGDPNDTHTVTDPCP